MSLAFKEELIRDPMNQDTELQTISQLVIEKSITLLKHVSSQPGQCLTPFETWINVSSDYSAWFTAFISTPQQSIQQRLAAYWQDAIQLLQTQHDHCLAGSTMPILDKRFSADEWVTNPFFNLLIHHYLLAREHIHSLLTHLNIADKQLARRVQFFTRQYLDILSPDNFIYTNPHLMAETIQCRGKNLLLGLKNFLNDMGTGDSPWIIPMTDKKAFTIGKNIAVTPGKVIFRNELIELIQYTPQTSKVSSVPLLIIPPWINKYYILDLSVTNSFIRWLVEQGLTVFVISWVNPDAGFANKGIAEYLHEGPIAAIEVILAQLKVPQINALGFCIGGTLLSMLLAYNKAQNITSIRSATFLASMIDFSDPGDISVYLDEKQITKLEEHMHEKGYLEGNMMASAFNSLRASELVWAFFIKNYLESQPLIPFDILFWNMDSTNMPAKMHSEYLRWTYLNNALVVPGKIQINTIPLNISSIDIPTYFVSTIKDHIAPWKTTYEGYRLMRGKKQFLLGGSGHIAGIVIPPGGEKYGYYLNNACPDHADEWLKNAHHHAGSWWPEWLLWLKKQSGRLINAPDFSQLPRKGIMNAYVLRSSSE